VFSAARWRLTLVFTAVLIVILLTSGVVVYLTTRSVMFNRVDSDLEDRAHRDAPMLSREPPPSDDGTGGDHDFIPREYTTGGYFYARLNSGGQVTSSSPNVDSAALATGDALAQALKGGETFASTKSSQGDSLRVYVFQPDDPHGDAGIVEVGRSTEPEEAALSQLRIILVAVLAVSVAPVLVGGYLLSGRALRPIKSAMDSQRAFIADASHELRTPVAVVRTNAELLKRHVGSAAAGKAERDSLALDDILSESDRLGRMVDQLLTLAQVDAGENALAVADVSFGELVTDVSRSMRPLATARSIDFQVEVTGEFYVHGDREVLRELIVILLDNAFKYVDPRARVELSLKKSAKRVELTVSDTGPGIPADAIPHIFDRFYRVDKARSRESGGSGLGLAIARHIAQAHGGAIRLESMEGKGTTVTVELPASG